MVSEKVQMAKRIYCRRMGTASRRRLTGQFAAFVFALTCAASLVCLLTACGVTQNETQTYRASTPAAADAHNTASVPFSLAIVSGTNKSITMSEKTESADEFFVVLTNISKEPQPVFEYWNRWGFQVISFELSTADGKRFVLTVKDHGFDKNVPDTYTVEPSEHQVFAIRLDESWQVQPALTVVEGMPIILKTVYQVSPTRESAQHHVWTDRVESHSYSLSLWRCPPSCSPLFTHGVHP
jgi:hypothetical protein